MAAKSTASDSLQMRMVSSGRGLPVASVAAPPMRASVNSKLTPAAVPAWVRTALATCVISGPIPSPARLATCLAAACAAAGDLCAFCDLCGCCLSTGPGKAAGSSCPGIADFALILCRLV